MVNWMRRVALPILAAVLLTACQAGSGKSPATPPATAESPTAAAGPGPGGAQAPAPVVNAPPLVLVRLTAAGDKLEAIPADPGTLADLPDRKPISFGHHYTYAVSPDGRRLAVVTFPTDLPRDGVLQIIDLASWTAKPTGITLNGDAAGFTFAPDGSALYWLAPGTYHPDHHMPRSYGLHRFDLASGQTARLTVLPESLMPRDLRVAPDGQRIAIYGVPTDTENLAEGPPHLLMLNAADGKVRFDLALPGVSDGQRKAGGPFIWDSPALAWDWTGGKVRIIDGANDRYTLVGLSTGDLLRQEPIAANTPVLDRLARWLVPTAEAKMTAGTSVSAALAPDGSRLYVTGRRSEKPPAEVSLGLRVIGTQNMTQTKRLEIDATDLRLSPDGAHLLLIGTHVDGDGHLQKGGIIHLDAVTLKERAHVAPREDARVAGFGPDSRQAYIVVPGDQAVTLQRYDLTAAKVAAERKLPGHFADLIDPAQIRN